MRDALWVSCCAVAGGSFRLQALQSPDDLFSLFASLHSCVARSTSPPRHRAAAAASPACQPVTRGSALGLFLRSLLLSFHLLPFQAVCDVLGDIHEYLHHAGCSASTGSTEMGSMDEQAAGRRESTGEASHGEWGSGEGRGNDGGEEMEVDVGVEGGVDGGEGVGIEGGEPLAFDTVTHRRRTTREGTRESRREAAGGVIGWDGGRGAGRRSSGGMVGVEGEAGEEGRESGEGQGRWRRKQRGVSGMQKQFLREAGRLAEYLDCRIEQASRRGAAAAGPRSEQGREGEGSGGAVDGAHADDQRALAHAHDLPPKVHLWQHHESLASRHLSDSLSSLHRYFDYRCPRVQGYVFACSAPVHMAQQESDDVCLVHALTAICHLLSQTATSDAPRQLAVLGAPSSLQQPTLLEGGVWRGGGGSGGKKGRVGGEGKLGGEKGAHGGVDGEGGGGAAVGGGVQQQVCALLQRCLVRAAQLRLPRLVFAIQLLLTRYSVEHVTDGRALHATTSLSLPPSDFTSADDLAASAVKLLRHRAAHSGAAAALPLLHRLQQHPLLSSSPSLRIAELELTHDLCLATGRTSQALHVCEQLAAIATRHGLSNNDEQGTGHGAGQGGTEVDLELEAACRHVHTLVAASRFPQAASAAKVLFTACCQHNRQLYHARCLLLLAELHLKAGSPAAALPHALACASLAARLHALLLQATATLTAAEATLALAPPSCSPIRAGGGYGAAGADERVGGAAGGDGGGGERSSSGRECAAQALWLLDGVCLPVLLGQSGLSMRCRTLMLIAQCHLALLPPAAVPGSAPAVLPLLEEAASGFHTMQVSPSQSHPVTRTPSLTPSHSHQVIHTKSLTPSRSHQVTHTKSLSPRQFGAAYLPLRTRPPCLPCVPPHSFPYPPLFPSGARPGEGRAAPAGTAVPEMLS
ncbi:unnamed protein product [Closterium sp. Yama58-4]|nr:unnamed protein product [Closterium sp. Yama58-4]